MKNQDFKRIGEETSDEDDVIDDDTMSMDSVASFWDPCKQRFEAVFIDSKRRANKPSQDDIVKWINKCRSAQEFIEGALYMVYIKKTEKLPECVKGVFLLYVSLLIR
ncbi:hypothetical protein IHQ11_23390 [Priestia megaterium]|uniref:hypothetical protein n=1 Tax=Priestia megaterium TaxID=1404 RepID=UPI001B3A394C|nr:hypothetical protein [Priestia megaterium]MBQ4869417.1 hypothetical protein [Priestia megaterium]MEB2277445.1 hypothetical protein [Bacillus sp. ILBB4]